MATSMADQPVPFRGKSSHHHYNWARIYHCRPEYYFEPESVEEVQKIVSLARKCRRRIAMVGIGHSPNELTLTSSWLLDLRRMRKVLRVKRDADGTARVLVQAGIYLHDLNNQTTGPVKGFILPTIGSIDLQSLAGAMSTATHGSSHKHGLLSQNVMSLRIVLANGEPTWCSQDDKPDLFRAALCSLGALGVITEVEYRMVPQRNLEYHVSLVDLKDFLDRYHTDIWTKAEYVRCWWMPYTQRVIVWQGEATDKQVVPPSSLSLGRLFAGYYVYQSLLWISNFVPRILPAIEWYIFGMQNRFTPGLVTSGVGKQQDALLMDCLYSQWVNEWALPLEKGPEAIDRLSKWLNGDEANSRIPFSSKHLWVHCPIEVRISDTSAADPRPFLDSSYRHGPTLYLNATLYRAFQTEPPCKARYYEAFEWLMKDLGGTPHWAKNYEHVSVDEVHAMYGDDLAKFLQVRNEVDPLGMFIGPWHRKKLLGSQIPSFALEEQELQRDAAATGGTWVTGSQIPSKLDTLPPPRRETYKSDESFVSVTPSTSSTDVISLASNNDESPV